jgi:hypothetical protein
MMLLLQELLEEEDIFAAKQPAVDVTDTRCVDRPLM